VLEIAVERKDVSGVHLIGQVDEASVGEIAGRVGVFGHQVGNLCDAIAESKGNLYCFALQICQNRLNSRVSVVEKIKRFR
jgi:hypothetical protein